MLSAMTEHYTEEGIVKTYSFDDNRLQNVQNKKSAIVYNGGKNQVNIITERNFTDELGRALRKYLPDTEPINAGLSYNKTASTTQNERTEYDEFDRPIKQTLVDGSTITYAYEFVKEQGETMERTTITDPLGHATESYTDQRGRTRKTIQKGNGDDITVTYDYNAIGDLLTVTHPDDTQTKYTYDNLGRKLSVNHPDAGLTEFEYDAAGNILKKITPNLRGMNRVVTSLIPTIIHVLKR